LVSTDADAEAELTRINNLSLSFTYHNRRRLGSTPAKALQMAKQKLGLS